MCQPGQSSSPAYARLLWRGSASSSPTTTYRYTTNFQVPRVLDDLGQPVSASPKVRRFQQGSRDLDEATRLEGKNDCIAPWGMIHPIRGKPYLSQLDTVRTHRIHSSPGPPNYHRVPSTGYNPLFLFSASHRSIHAFMRSRLFRLPTFTVGITRPIRRAQQNMVSSRNELCSLYGTP